MTALDGIGVDLFLTERDRWSSVFTIRIGDAEFTMALGLPVVTPAERGSRAGWILRRQRGQ